MSHNNRSKEKGTAAEVAVVQFLRNAGGYAGVERRSLAGKDDRGDVAGIPGLVIEVKNAETMKLALWMDEAKHEAFVTESAGPFAETLPQWDLAVVWHKRRGKGSPGEWYVTMDGWTFLEFLKEWTK